MSALDECHAKGFMWKAVGGCSNIKQQVNMCLRKERLARTAENRERSKQKNQQIQSLWKEVDTNS